MLREADKSPALLFASQDFIRDVLGRLSQQGYAQRENRVPSSGFFDKITAFVIALIPALVLALLVPNAFLGALDYAGKSNGLQMSNVHSEGYFDLWISVFACVSLYNCAAYLMSFYTQGHMVSCSCSGCCQLYWLGSSVTQHQICL
jgi:hypothetical protein